MKIFSSVIFCLLYCIDLQADCRWSELENGKKICITSHLEGITNGKKDSQFMVLKMWLSKDGTMKVKLDKIEAIWFLVHGSPGDECTFIAVGDNAGGLFNGAKVEDANVTDLGSIIEIDFPSQWPGCYSNTKIIAKREELNTKNNFKAEYKCNLIISYRESLSHEDANDNIHLEVGKTSNEHEYKPIESLILPNFKII